MRNMLTPLVLGNAVTGGFLVLAMPHAFGSLLSLRYPDKRALLGERRGEAVEQDARARAVRPGSSQEDSVVAPHRLESLRASRERQRAPGPSAGLSHAA